MFSAVSAILGSVVWRAARTVGGLPVLHRSPRAPAL